MDLSERKKNILKAVINENIKTAEPVSSSELQKEYLSDVSSATIRNELAALEEMGFLVQPHTSSGRVPTLEGYKKYIAELMTEQKLTKSESEQIKKTFEGRVSSVSDIIEKTASVISEASNYASIVSLGITDYAEINSFKLVEIDDSNILVLVKTDIGTIKEIISCENITIEDINSASAFMSSKLVGKSLKQATEIIDSLPQELVKYKNLFEAIIEVITDKSDRENMAVAGKEKLLDYPEYQDLGKFKSTLKDLNSKQSLRSLINDDDDLEISIKLGDGEKLDYSVVTAKYKIGGKVAGTASVLGPVRMDYSKVVSILKNVTSRLEENINGQAKKGDKDE